MGAITENGWAPCARAHCETLLVPGTEGDEVRFELLRGDVATILTAWAAWFDRNVRPINDESFRNWWACHLSATAIDVCANQLPWTRRTMPADQVERTERGLALFEGTVFWGRWWDRADEMHFQIGLPPTNSKLHEFAERVRGGYLGIFGPPDPLAFPLPAVSGEFESDSQYAKEGLKAATTLQLEKGWQANPLFGRGGVCDDEPAKTWLETLRDKSTSRHTTKRAPAKAGAPGRNG